ncbi:MAG: ABC transporter substrate-binding protein [Bacilli bacterium]|nr:ABC transporter substrate-binding protein [Bacilli bacterium]
MNIKKILFALSSVAVMTLTSCGGSGLKHTTSKFNDVYHVDLNHDGRIADFKLGEKIMHEDNLTWIEAYDTLISEANSMADLNAVADNLNIAKDELKRTSLARYEILHQAEELLMSTGAIIPLYNYGDPYLLKPNLTGIYTMNLGYKYMDKLHDPSNPSLKDFTVSVGTKAETFDPGSNSDVSTCLAMNQFLIGAKRYSDLEHVQEEGEREGIYRATLTDGVCNVKKRLVTSDKDKAKEDDYVWFDDCPDLMDEMNLFNTDEEKQAIRDNYELTARYTLTMKPDACWNDGSPIVADDFIYAWARASSGVYNGQSFGMWCEMFDAIRGFEAWNLIGQQETDDVSKWKERDQESWNSLSEIEQNQYMQAFNGVKVQGIKEYPARGCAGGMAGILKESDTEFTVQLINDSDYFESNLAFTAFMPVAKKNVIIVPEGKTEQNAICKEDGDWWLNKNGEYLTNGPLQIDGPIDNNDSGGINFKRPDHVTPGIGLEPSDDTVTGLHFKFIDKDSTIYDSYKSGTLQMTNQFPSSVLSELEKMPDWCVAQQLGLFFYGFNVNDNTFDIKPESDRISGERNREKLRQAASLLVNTYDIAVNVARKGSTPANGYVSDGITETCVPVWSETAVGPDDTLGAYIAKTEEIEGKDEYVPANWHERNKNMYEYLGYEEDPTKAEYKNHIMDKREPGGFIPIANKKEEEEAVMKANAAEAIRLAKEAGVNYDEATGKFTNFPRINIATNNGSALEDIAERIQAYYSLWGIDASISTMEWQSFTAARRIGDFACAREGWVADYNDPRTYLDLCVSTSGNNDTQLGKDNWHASH